MLRGWREDGEDLWRIPIVETVCKYNTDTILVNKPQTEFSPDRPEPSEAVHNVYKLKKQPEVVQYLHAAVEFPTKPTFLAAIKNKQYPEWPDLTVDAVQKHFPESEETHKGRGRKTPSVLRSTKPKSLPNQSSFFSHGRRMPHLGQRQQRAMGGEHENGASTDQGENSIL